MGEFLVENRSRLVAPSRAAGRMILYGHPTGIRHGRRTGFPRHDSGPAVCLGTAAGLRGLARGTGRNAAGRVRAAAEPALHPAACPRERQAAAAATDERPVCIRSIECRAVLPYVERHPDAPGGRRVVLDG